MTLDDDGVEGPSESMLFAFLGVLTGFAFGFGAFGSALWANIHVDGHPTATTTSTLASILPLALVFLLPGVLVMVWARRRSAQRAKSNFGWTAVTVMGLLTGGLALVPVVAILGPWAVSRLVRSLDYRSPPVHLAAMVAGPAMMWFFASAEANR